MTLQGWLPVRVLLRGSEVRVEWTLIGNERLLDPFFEETVNRKMMRPFHQVFRRETSVDEMVAWVEQNPGVPLRGLIFHESRCGSTLLAQQLAELSRNIVASEPPPLDSMLRARWKLPSLPRETQLQWVRAVVGALAQARHREDALYIKMDCWSTHEMELMLEAFPAVPWVFLYREPEAVMIQHQQLPAAWLVPGLLDPRVLRLTREDWQPDRREVYAARALAKICAAGLDGVRRFERGLLVNHTELPEAMYGRLLPHFGLREADVPAMRERGRHDAKVPLAMFEGDEAFEREEMLVKVRTAVREHLQAVYEEMEAKRLARM